MDNLTHSLAGIVCAELVVQARRARGDEVDSRWSRAAWLVSAGAHNAPDVDFAYSWITEGRLGYLLHHRGHTHTLALAPLMALLPLVLAWIWARRAKLAWSRADHAWLIVLALVGAVGHLWLDFSNNYGVHPFWPIENRWIAADSIFIVEPLFFAATIPMAMLATRSRTGRIAWGVVLAITLALPWAAASYVAWPFALGTTIVGALVLAATARVDARWRPIVALSASFGVLVTFAVSGARGEAQLRAVLAREAPREEIVDVARMPMPTAPPCWEAVVTSIDRASERYAIHVMRVSAWPELVPVSTCLRMPRLETTAPLVRAPRELDRAVHLESTLTAELDALRAIAARCDGAAFLRFARVPFVVDTDAAIVLGDARYDRERGESFAEMEIPRVPPSASECPRFVPPWTPWRASDLLE
ncbi:metal-dependent hydrolase [Sandaracinus amylolyticus]|uniref:Membrane-bound metal-dependent hydrolase n=1 Tax=Sandaracinus amylolyticus TaxID=927083 RepID=A0A0F6YI17_9BACT|nr:metal-dependent hydrolase [Sandaracinus amylolyticus]AKF05685.1 Membrane-bound metal-dependent hydrolase [Sandaracinus amylolyticus]